MKPISPRFVGKGPACGPDSCVRVVEEVDAIAAVDAIIGLSGKSGERENCGNVKREWDKFGATSSLLLARIIGGTPASNEGNEGRGREEGRRIKAGRVWLETIITLCGCTDRCQSG